MPIVRMPRRDRNFPNRRETRCAGVLIAVAIFLVGAMGIGDRAASGETHSLQVHVVGAAKPTGKIHVALFDDPEAFPDGKEFASASSSVGENDTAALAFDDLPTGHYAISLYHDANGNGEFDQAIFGIPEERYGFSRIDVEVGSKPVFEQAEFEIREDMSIEIKLVGP